MIKKQKLKEYFSNQKKEYIVVYDPTTNKTPEQTGVWELTGVVGNFTLKDGLLFFYTNNNGTNFYPLRNDKDKNFQIKVKTCQPSFGTYQLVRFYFLDKDGNELINFKQNGYSISISKNGEEVASLSLDYDTRACYQNFRVEKIDNRLYLYSKGNNTEYVEPTLRYSISVNEKIETLYITFAAASAGNCYIKYMEYKEW